MEYEEFEDNYEPEDIDEDSDEPHEYCPFCGDGICSSYKECSSCDEHVVECASMAGVDPDTGETVTFTIIALF